MDTNCKANKDQPDTADATLCDDEWELLDAQAEEQERRVIAELAGAQQVKARMDQRQEQRAQKEQQKEEEAAKAEHKAQLRQTPDEELSEGQLVLRHARKAARTAVQLRRTCRTAFGLAILGIIDIGIGAYMGHGLLIALGVACTFACLFFGFRGLPAYKEARAEYDLRAAELVKYKAEHPEDDLGGERA